MADSLDMQVITEGVETREQLDILHTFHCDVIQGNYFFKPLSLRDYEKLLKKTNSGPFVKSADADAFREELLAECTLCIKKGNYENALKLALRAADTITVNRNSEQYFQVMNLTADDIQTIFTYISLPI